MKSLGGKMEMLKKSVDGWEHTVFTKNENLKHRKLNSIPDEFPNAIFPDRKIVGKGNRIMCVPIGDKEAMKRSSNGKSGWRPEKWNPMELPTILRATMNSAVMQTKAEDNIPALALLPKKSEEEIKNNVEIAEDLLDKRTKKLYKKIWPKNETNRLFGL